MRGVFSVGGNVSLIVIRNTVIESRALIPKVTFSPDSDGTQNTRRAGKIYIQLYIKFFLRIKLLNEDY